jgi:transcriptional regulator with XRE-family HTH domain
MSIEKKVNNTCGSRLKEERKRKHLTQESLAELVHVDPKYISALENNRRNMSVDLANDLSKILHVRAKYLMGHDDARTPLDAIMSKKYTFNELLTYLIVLERNDYTLTTPFGDDGDTALMSFLFNITDDIVLSHGDQHYLCSVTSFRKFLNLTSATLQTIKLSLISQFISGVCTEIDNKQVEEKMSTLLNKVKTSMGESYNLWINEQRKFDNYDFDAIDGKKYNQGIDEMSKKSVLEDMMDTDPEDLLRFLNKRSH